MREFNFGGGMPDPKSFPWKGLIEAAQKVLAREGERLVLYPGSAGYLPLREIASQRYEKREGIPLDVDKLCLTTGSMQAIELVVRAFIEPGDGLVCEEFTYSGSLGVFRRLKANLVGIPVDEEGMVIDALEETLNALAAKGQKPKLIYTIASNQNPTGTILSLERRKRLIALAQEHEIPVLEDDCYGDLNFEGTPYPPSLYTLDDSGLVVFVGSFSKIMGPGLRLGYFAAKTQEMFNRIMQNKMDGGVSALASMIVAEYLKEHLWEHVAEVNAVLREKLHTLYAALEEHLGDLCTWSRPPGGLFLWVKLPEETDTQKLSELARERGVIYAAGRAFHYANDDVKYLRIAFGYPSLEEIREGVAVLAECLRKSLAAGVVA